jgi:predicted nucleotidyltransferase
MDEAGTVDAAVRGSWHALVLQDFKNTLAARPWSRDILLRGSLARGAQDLESDIDLVAAVAEAEFETALNDLSGVLPRSLQGRMPPWLDDIVTDFGGLGFVYLVQVDEKKWGQVDIYLLPQGRKQRLLDNEFVLPLRAGHDPEPCDDVMSAHIEIARRRYEEFAARDLQQAVLACYVALFLLRKRLSRGDRLQIFADTYVTAQRVRELVFAACYADEPVRGWRDVPLAAERSADPDLILKVMAIFARQDVLELAGLADRVAGLEDLVGLLAPAVWREHGESLRGVGRYLSKSSQAASRV